MTLPFTLTGRILQHTRHYATRSRASGRGQNLSERYIRLEKSLREKQALATGIQDLETREDVTEDQSRKSIAQRRPENMFKGLVVPDRPKAPESDECCMSGCAVCVYDLFEESLDAYKDKVGALRSRLTDMGVPEYEWPTRIRAGDPDKSDKKANVTLSVFEEMERAMHAKRATRREIDYVRPLESSPPTSTAKRVLQESVEGLRWIVFSNH